MLSLLRLLALLLVKPAWRGIFVRRLYASFFGKVILTDVVLVFSGPVT